MVKLFHENSLPVPRAWSWNRLSSNFSGIFCCGEGGAVGFADAVALRVGSAAVVELVGFVEVAERRPDRYEGP